MPSYKILICTSFTLSQLHFAINLKILQYKTTQVKFLMLLMNHLLQLHYITLLGLHTQRIFAKLNKGIFFLLVSRLWKLVCFVPILSPQEVSSRESHCKNVVDFNQVVCLKVEHLASLMSNNWYQLVCWGGFVVCFGLFYFSFLRGVCGCLNVYKRILVWSSLWNWNAFSKSGASFTNILLQFYTVLNLLRATRVVQWQINTSCLKDCCQLIYEELALTALSKHTDLCNSSMSFGTCT